MRMRLRPGAFDDGAFEEVAHTVEATRKAFYFHTASDRYRPGMRLRVRFPYDPNPHSRETDDIGEVIRVDRKGDGYGVAIAFWKQGAEPASAGRSESAQEARRGGAERRGHARHQLVAAVELIDLPTGLKARANTSDLGMGGCYVNTLNPFRLGATLVVNIEHAGVTLEAEAIVCTRFEGSGMGLAFRNVTPMQMAVLSDWMPTKNSVAAD